MQYDLQIENVSNIKRRLRFTITQDVVQTELDKAYQDLKKQANLPGFRRGKVPRSILEARFGRRVNSDVSSQLIDRSWRDVIDQFELAGQPRLEDSGKISKKSDFIFVIEVDVKPEVDVENYKGVDVPFRVQAVSDDEVQAEIDQQLQGQARIEEVTDDRGVEPGDYVLTEMVLTDGDEETAREAGTLIKTDEERYYPGVEALLYGMKKDEEKVGAVTIGENTIFEHLRGKEFQASVKVLNIQAQTVPALDDALAETMGYEGGADAMRAALRMKLEQSREEAARNDARVLLLQSIVNDNDFEIPDAMVDEQLQALVEELKVRRAYSGQNPDQIRFSDAEMSDLRRRATFAAKASVLLESIARKEEINVGDDVIDARIAEIAGMRGQTPEAIRGYLLKENAMDTLRARLSEEKTLEWLLEHAALQHEEVGAEPATEAEEVSAASEEE